MRTGHDRTDCKKTMRITPSKPDSSAGKDFNNFGPRRRLWLRRLMWLAVAVVVFFAIATAGYMILERNYSLLDAIYMTMITITTVGFTEVNGPLTDGGRIWTMIVMVSGMTLVALVVSGVVAVFVESQIREVFGRQQLQQKIAKLKGHVIVCGFGRVGSMVASQLVQSGREVVVVDQNEDAIAAARAAGLLYVDGDAQEEDVLEKAGVKGAESLVTALTTDAENVFVTLSARSANANLRIITRAQQTSSENKLRKAGASRVICPQAIGANRMAQVVLRPAVVDFTELAQTGSELAVDQITVTPASPLVDKTLRELELPSRFGVHVVAMQRQGGKRVYNPAPDIRLAVGDVVILVGRAGAAETMQKLGVEEELPENGEGSVDA